MHERAHDSYLSEKRGDIITTGDMPVFSRRLGITGKCDIVEFIRDENGVSLRGRDGNWIPRPVEYKRGSPKKTDADELQLCAQALCLEEMLLCPKIENAYIFYGEPRRRESVPLTDALREKVKSMFIEMRSYYDRRYTPRVKKSRICGACSLKDVCLPGMSPPDSVRGYIDSRLEDRL
jgi:CRISPR-associated exonuclease Cas4